MQQIYGYNCGESNGTLWVSGSRCLYIHVHKNLAWTRITCMWVQAMQCYLCMKWYALLIVFWSDHVVAITFLKNCFWGIFSLRENGVYPGKQRIHTQTFPIFIGRVHNIVQHTILPYCCLLFIYNYHHDTDYTHTNLPHTNKILRSLPSTHHFTGYQSLGHIICLHWQAIK